MNKRSSPSVGEMSLNVLTLASIQEFASRKDKSQLTFFSSRTKSMVRSVLRPLGSTTTADRNAVSMS
ncbi:hypothetical protein GT695_03095 [Citrobacter amalonaticus]|nr:hypothetical protein [Citrobacter amalonaticus]MZK92579.1 hypothetical protein [Citrobacter amalonaticus]MZL02223.1 hypothetical protein [Citrobacter amalonaticus]MZL24661.1 hypothetical protein [Citrobacter amalonaticus]MZS49956.1 hypothetical protein [Citrobacter amalonaticus]